MILIYLMIFTVLPMKNIKEESITEFYAMEYVNVIGNRILKVWVTDEYVFLAKMKGFTSEGIAISKDSKFVIHRSRRNDPKAYVKEEEEAKYKGLDFTKLDPKEFMEINQNNFVITRTKIESIWFNPKKKWGMGNYPHNGRIMFRTKKELSNKKKKIELILIGLQDEEPIMKRLKMN